MDHLRESKTIGWIKSGMLSQGDRFGEVGHYELDIVMDYSAFKADPDKPGFLRKTISTHLTGCAASTGIPPGEGLWHVRLADWTVNHFPHLPREFKI